VALAHLGDRRLAVAALAGESGRTTHHQAAINGQLTVTIQTAHTVIWRALQGGKGCCCAASITSFDAAQQWHLVGNPTIAVWRAGSPVLKPTARDEGAGPPPAPSSYFARFT